MKPKISKSNSSKFISWSKYIFILFLCCIICLASTPIFAKPAQVIRIGYCNNSTTVEETERGYTGYSYDYLMEIAKYTNWQYEFVEGSVEEGMQALKDGKIDFMGPMQYTAERAKEFAYTEVALGMGYPALYTLKSNSDLAFNDFEAFDGMTVGLIQGNQCNRQFQEFAQKNNFSYNNIYFAQSQDALDALNSNTVDAIIETQFVDQTNLKAICRFSVNQFYYITTLDKKDLSDQMNDALLQIQLGDMYFTQRLEQKYYGDKPLAIKELTRAEREYVQNNRTLKVAINPNFLPLEAFDPKTGEPVGINISLFAKIADYSGFQLEYVKTNTFAESLESIKQNQAQVISGDLSLMDNNTLTATNTIADLPVAVISNQSVLLSKSTKIAVPTYFATTPSPSLENIESEFVFYPDIFECFSALKSGEVDATLANIYLYDYLRQSDQYGDLKMVSMLNSKNEVRLYVPTSSAPMLLSILNKAISSLNETALNSALTQNTIERSYEISPLSLFKKYYWILIILCSLLVGFYLVSFLFHRTKMTRKLEQMAYMDTLTGARSMEKFWKDSDVLFAKYDCENYSLVYMDIDRFKYINDIYGYKTGNDILRITANSIQEMLYDYEIFARLSADIFILLLKNTDQKQLTEFISRLQRNVQQTCALNKLGVALTISAGIYPLTKEEKDFYVQLDRANLARKQIKGVHDKFCAFYDDGMHKKLMRESEIIDVMQDALDHGEFVAYYQPKHDLKTGKICGAEALVRWISPEKGIIPPDHFIPLFERNGFVTKIDFHVYEQTCKLLRSLLDRGEFPCPISVNLSRVHMRSRNFIQKLERIADEYQIPRDLLELELTETAILGNEDELKAIMNLLKERGFGISMDDFGTGYSSLNLLKDLPVDILKIDRGFFNKTDVTGKEKTVIQDIVTMAHHLNMKVVSEGVETETQRQFLIEINSDVAQGFLYSKALPPDDFILYLRKNQ